jgi:haloalkane dehalogenase
VTAYRTPDERFAGLAGYPFAPHYLEMDLGEGAALRMHYLDEGRGTPVLLLHGEPTWSYLYRTMIPALRQRHRVLAPDFFGFGRSDKPLAPEFYTYDRHCESIRQLIQKLDLRDITLVVQDWGGPIGLRLAVELEERFARLVILNTGLFTGQETASPGFLRWRAFAERSGLDLPIARVITSACARPPSAEVLAGYEAPFPTRESKSGAARFPLIVPLKPEDPGAAEMRRTHEALGRWQKPALVMFSDSDPVFTPAYGERLAAHIPTAGKLRLVEHAAHFLQEDQGPALAEAILAFTAP